AFTRGAEADFARALWDSVSLETPRLAEFDGTWFEPLLRRLTLDRSLVRRQDWGEAPEHGALYGRSAELQLLSDWVVDEHCRLIVLLGMGGMGKTALATRLAADLAPSFDAVYWRSLRLGLPPEAWLAGAIAFLSNNQRSSVASLAEWMQQL